MHLAGFADDLVIVVGSFLAAKQIVAELIVALQKAGLSMALELGKIFWASPVA